jgi:hypothetical protein
MLKIGDAALLVVFGLFWLIAGLLLAPVWLVIVLVGASIGAVVWEDAPGLWWDFVLVKWFW